MDVYVDSSFRSKDHTCQTGFVYWWNGKVRKQSSEAFIADNNNDAEIYGVYLAIKHIHEEYSVKDFSIFTDSAIANGMLKQRNVLSKRVLIKHPTLNVVLQYLEKNRIALRTTRVSRQNNTLKVADKLSKEYRKNKK